MRIAPKQRYHFLIGVSSAALVRKPAPSSGHFPEGTVYTSGENLFFPHVRLPVPAGRFCQLDHAKMGRHLREQSRRPSGWTDLPSPRRNGIEYGAVGRGKRDD